MNQLYEVTLDVLMRVRAEDEDDAMALVEDTLAEFPDVERARAQGATKIKQDKE